MAGLDDDRRRNVGGACEMDDDRMRPGGQRVQERDPAVPDGQACGSGRRAEDVVRGKDDVQQSRFRLGHLHGLAIDGDRWSDRHVHLPRTVPQLGFSGAVPLERAALERGCCDEDLGAGLYGARCDAVWPKRRDCAAEVEAPGRGTASAEWVLVGGV